MNFIFLILQRNIIATAKRAVVSITGWFFKKLKKTHPNCQTYSLPKPKYAQDAKLKKDIENFSLRLLKKGYHCHCKSCVSIRGKSYYSANKERHAVLTRKWRVLNKEG
jgi:hypothetical protein